ETARSSRAAASEHHVAIEVLVHCGGMAGVLYEAAGQFIRQIPNMLTGLDVALKESQERADGGVFVLSSRPMDEHLAVLSQLKAHLVASLDAQRLADRLGQGDLSLGGDGGDFVDGRHDGSRPLCTHGKEFSLPRQASCSSGQGLIRFCLKSNL